MADTQFTSRREFTRTYTRTPGASGLFPITIEKSATFTHGGAIKTSKTWAKDFQKALDKDTTDSAKKLMGEVLSSLMDSSPEDTGLMRYSWFVTTGKIARGIASDKPTSVSPTSVEQFRRSAPRRNKDYEKKPPTRFVNKNLYKKKLAKLKLGKGLNKRISIVNNVYYTSSYDQENPFISSAIDEGVDKYIRSSPSDISDDVDVDWMF